MIRALLWVNIKTAQRLSNTRIGYKSLGNARVLSFSHNVDSDANDMAKYSFKHSMEMQNSFDIEICDPDIYYRTIQCYITILQRIVQEYWA